MASGGSINNFPSTWASALLMLTWTDRKDGEWRLTEGEEEGIKANLTAWWNLRDEPLGDTADGH